MRRFIPLELLTLLLLAFVAGGCNCGGTPPDTLSDGGPGSTDGGPTGSTVSIAISPQNPTVTYDGTTPARISFTVTATDTDGKTSDVTSKALFQIGDDGLGYFTGSQFTSRDRGGTSTVTATVDALQATTQLYVKDQQSFEGPGDLPSDPSTPFGNTPDASRAPTLVYPNDGVLLPPNLGRLEFHFLPGAGNDLFRLTFSNAVTNVSVYVGCDQAFTKDAGWGSFGSGCIYTPNDAVWKALAETNRGGDPIQVTVAGTTADGKSGVGTSAPIRLSFAFEDLNGGIYYWNTIGKEIMRYDFAGTQTSADRYLDSSSAGVTCLGCHALSRDGQKMVAEGCGQEFCGNVLKNIVDGGSQLSTANPTMFESWNPDSTRYVGVYTPDSTAYPQTDPGLMLFNGVTGAKVGSIPGTGTSTHPADHPDWSMDGQHIVYVRVGDNTFSGSNPGGTGGTSQRMHEGSIWVVDRESDGGWSAPRELVAEAPKTNYYYPAFSPDGRLIVFDRSVCLGPGDSSDKSCNADTDPTATLYAITPDGGMPVDLEAANTPGLLDTVADGGVQTELTDSFPKWSPFITRRSAKNPDATVMWLTFSSTRNFGLRQPLTSTNDEGLLGRSTYLWMVAVDPSKMANGEDPSYPAFVLPFQDFSTSNHIAQWTTKVVGTQCVPLGSACTVGGMACCQDQGPTSCQAAAGQDKCEPIIN